MDVPLAILLVVAIAGLSAILASGRGGVNPNDGEHDWLKYEMLGRPTNCRECFERFVEHDFYGIRTVRCPKKGRPGDGHEHFRWMIKDEEAWRGP